MTSTTPVKPSASPTKTSDNYNYYYDPQAPDNQIVQNEAVVSSPHHHPVQAARDVARLASSPASDQPRSLSDDSSESDMDSLRSYHPPAKVIDVPSATRLAKRLYYLDGFKKTDVSRHLSRNNEFNQVVAEEYLKFFNFSDCTLDMALRVFLSQFCLTGETQERERVLIHFSKRYLECNPSVVGPSGWFRSQDSVHTLTCAIMLLNTDMHGGLGSGGGTTGHRKMTCAEFVENLSELNDGHDFPRELLKNIYYAIKSDAIPWAQDDDEMSLNGGQPSPNSTAQEAQNNQQVPKFPQPEHGNDWKQSLPPGSSQPPGGAAAQATTSGINLGKTAGGINPFLPLPDPENSVDYKKGYVMRKCCVDPNGKKTKVGKRSWKMYFLCLRDMVLYCFKDSKSLGQPGAYEDLNCAIRVHHALAERAADYTKKQFVFRLHTADQAQYLFQTSDEKELLTWIDAINYVVAAHSAPQLPAPCSSDMGRFQRPLMPSSMSTLGVTDQLANHEKHLSELRVQIEDHLQSPPPKSSKAGVLQAYRDKQDFLRFEITRYDTYILTLRTRKAPARQLDNQSATSQPGAAPAPVHHVVDDDSAGAMAATPPGGSRYWSDH